MMMFNCRANKQKASHLIVWVFLLSVALFQQSTHAAEDDWKIKIKTSVDSYSSSITFGEFADATDGYDVVYDGPAHTAPAAVVAYFDHPEWGQADTKFWYDIQSKGRTRQWSFNTDSNLDGQALTLEWYFANVPADLQLTLTDTSTSQTVDMMAETSYSYISGALRQFTITAILPQPPLLTITNPIDGAIVNSSEITLTGTATDAGQGDEGVASVMVNGQAASGGAAVGADTAQWSYMATLNEGANVFTIIATDDGVYGDQISESIAITYTPPNLDTDSDGLLDDWELTHFGDLTSHDASSDSDDDGLSNSDEYSYGTDPNSADSDGDGIADGAEVDLGIDPANSDTDGDGDSDNDEILYGSDPALISDTIDLHRPYQPVLQQISAAVAFIDQMFDSEAFDDVDLLGGDYLMASHWQISSGQSFADVDIVLDRQLERDSGATMNSILHRQLLVPDGVLRKTSQYWIRTRHQDSTGLWSDWSDAISFNTIEEDPNDLLGDGIDDRYQVVGFVDTDSSGIDDNEEESIYAVNVATLSDTVGLSPSLGEIGYLSVLDSGEIAEEQLPEESLNYHWFDFRIDGLDIDVNNPASVDITFYFPEALPSGAKWYKYDRATQTVSDYTNYVVIDGSLVTLTLTDGGLGDADGVVNGVIVDPSGPALPDSVAQISSGNGNESQVSATPTMQTGGSGAPGPLFLAAGLLILCLARQRKRRA